MGRMRANKLKLHPDKMEILLVGINLGNGFMSTLGGVALTPNASVRSVGVLLEPTLVLDAQVAAVSRGTFYQLWWVRQLQLFLHKRDLA